MASASVMALARVLASTLAKELVKVVVAMGSA
jgi:hypothetical protein